MVAQRHNSPGINRINNPVTAYRDDRRGWRH